MSGEAYAREKLYQALDCIISPAPLKDRLMSAGHFLVKLKSGDFPEQLRPNYLQIMASLEGGTQAVSGGGQIDASVQAMTDDEAENLAKAILKLYIELTGGL